MLLTLQYYNQPPAYNAALDYLNIIFTTVFAIEFVLKLFAFRVKVSRRHLTNGFKLIQRRRQKMISGELTCSSSRTPGFRRQEDATRVCKPGGLHQNSGFGF